MKIKENIFFRFWKWCKKQVKVLGTIAGISLLFAGLQTYKAFFAPDISKEINATIINTVKEFQTYKPVEVPDSLRKTEEVCLLLLYQREFEIYKLYVATLNFDKIKCTDDSMVMSIHKNNINRMMVYMNKTKELNQLARRILNYESKIVHNENFEKNMDIQLFVEFEEVFDNLIKETSKVVEISQLYLRKDIKDWTSKEKEQLNNLMKKMYNSNTFLDFIKSHTKLQKNIYIATSIRLLEILNSYQLNVNRNQDFAKDINII